MKQRVLVSVLCLILLGACTNRSDQLAGMVVDEAGLPLTGAVVRVQTTENSTSTDETGKFTLSELAPGAQVKKCANARGERGRFAFT